MYLRSGRTFSNQVGASYEVGVIWAATHLVLNPFDPWTSGPPLPVPLDKIDPPGQTVPIKFSPHEKMVPKYLVPLEQMVPNQFGPPISGSPQSVPLDKRIILGTICPWGSNFGGPFVHGD